MQKNTLILLFFVFSCKTESVKDSGFTELSDSILEKKVDSIEIFCSNINPFKRHKFPMKCMEIEKSDLDDSLKNLCRPFNYRIPWEQTEIKSLPTRDYPEIDDRPEFSGFRIQTVARGRLNDTTVYHFNYLYRDNCHCKCILFLAGDTTSVHFKGFLKSEQIICNGFDVDGRF